MTAHVFLLPDGEEFAPDMTIGEAVLRLAFPIAAGKRHPFERTAETDWKGRTIWKPVPDGQLAVEEAERATQADPEGTSMAAAVQFVPGELEALPPVLRCQHFIRRCAYALKPGQYVQVTRELLLRVLGEG